MECVCLMNSSTLPLLLDLFNSFLCSACAELSSTHQCTVISLNMYNILASVVEEGLWLRLHSYLSF